jgi:hypothetical protein
MDGSQEVSRVEVLLWQGMVIGIGLIVRLGLGI